MIGELLDVLSTDPEDARRRKLLNIVLLGVGVATLLLLLATVVATVLGLAGEPGEVAAIYLGGLAVLFGSVVIYAINRYGAGWLASSIFLVLLTMVIAFSDRPREVVEGRSLFLFTIPIIMASVLLPPYTSFILAGLSGLVVAVVGLRVQIVPNPGVMFGFLVIALVSWLSARSLGRALKDLRVANESLRESEEQYRELVEKASDIIYTHDLEGNLTSVNPAATRIFGYTNEEALQLNIAQIVDAEYLPLARREIQEKLEGSPRTGPYELLTYSKEGKPIWVEVSSRLLEREGQPAEVLGIARNITERKRAEEELRESYAKLQQVLEGTVHVLISAIEMSDPYTAGHQRRVTRLACAIAEEMGLPPEQIEGLRMAGLIHDIGKITIPAEILSKPGPLSEIEWGLIRAHAQVGYDLLNGAIEFPWPVAQIVLQHHERMDGSGYPQGLSGEEIMLEARILAVSDVVEAMASYRPYRPARGLDKALEEISQHRGVLYDPEVVDACLKLFAEKGFRFEQGEGEAWMTEPAS